MIRIRGMIGSQAVDLTVEMDGADWARLGEQLNVEAPAAAKPETPPRPTRHDDVLWQNALRLVESAGQVSGPELLEQLEGLSGSPTAGKRLMVRLRHCTQVKVRSGGDAPLYCWLGG